MCFVGKVHLPEFLQQQLELKKGKAIVIPETAKAYSNGQSMGDLIAMTKPYVYQQSEGEVVGEHNGAHFYTIGQRKGLSIGGQPKPLFVIGTDTEHNILYMGLGENHPGLYRKGLFIPNEDEHWVREDLQLALGESRNYLARIRYRQPLESCTLHKKAEGLYIIFDKPQKAITPGQFAVWYGGEELIGSGVIA